MSETRPKTRMQRISYRAPTGTAEPEQLVLVEYVSDGRIAIITLNRPHADNAITTAQERRDLALENLALRQQRAVLKAKNHRPTLTRADRLFWLMLSKYWGRWQDSLHIVQPATVIRWHRQGFRYYWRWKSPRRGRPNIERELRLLIREMSGDNPLWGAPRLHGELLKLGIEVSPVTVSKYMIRHPKPPSQDWKTFLHNHASELVSLDFLTVPTATFRVLYVLVILRHDRREILHVNVTRNPTAIWTARQLTEALGWDHNPRYLLRDRDGVYGFEFSRQVKALGMEEVVSAPRSPWQNAYVERVIGSIRRDCLDHVIVISDRQLRCILKEYIFYYNQLRTHLSLQKDTPVTRPTKPPGLGSVTKIKRVGGLHHEYTRLAA